MKRMNNLLSLILAAVIVVGILSTSKNVDFDMSALSLIANAEDYVTGNTIEFGRYPQSKVTDDATLTYLNSLSFSWHSYGYLTAESSSDSFMKYADVDTDADSLPDYRAVLFTEYRTSNPERHPQSDNGYYTNQIYWFEYEPLVWRCIDDNSGLFLCDSIVDSQHFNTNTIEETDNWGTSSIRSWLNESFYNTAFSDEEKNNIQRASITNYGYGNINCYDSTLDYVFLLSYDDVLNPNYGFSDDPSEENEARIAVGTDYAKSQGLMVGTDGISMGHSHWMLRSAGYVDDTFCMSVWSGSVYTFFDTISWNAGVRPALYMNDDQGIESVSITCSEIAYAKDGDFFTSSFIDKDADTIPFNLTLFNKKCSAMETSGCILSVSVGSINDNYEIPATPSGSSSVITITEPKLFLYARYYGGFTKTLTLNLSIRSQEGTDIYLSELVIPIEYSYEDAHFIPNCIFPRDAFRFPNIDETIPATIYTSVFGTLAGEQMFKKWEDGDTHGHCYGQSLVLSELLQSTSVVESFGENSICDLTETSYSTLKQEYLNNYIKTAFVTQFMSDKQKSRTNNKGTIKTFQAVKKSIDQGIPMLVEFFGGFDHTVLAVGYDAAGIIIYDPNFTNDFRHISINDNLWEYYAGGDKVIGAVFGQTINYIPVYDFDNIHINIDWMLDVPSKFEIPMAVGLTPIVAAYSNDDREEGNGLYWCDESFNFTAKNTSGKTQDIELINGDVKFVYAVGDNNEVNVDKTNTTLSANLDCIEGEMIKASLIRVDEERFEFSNVSISGTAASNSVKTETTQTGIKISGIKSVTITHMQGSTEITSTTPQVQNGDSVLIEVDENFNPVVTVLTTSGEDADEQTISNCVCGKYHTGPFAGIVKFFHKIIYFFKNLFK